MAQLALDLNNSPGWDVLEQERSISTKMPLYVKSLPVFHQQESAHTEVTCGASYSLMVPTPTRTLRKQTYVWANAAKVMTPGCETSDPNSSSHLRIFGVPTNHQAGLKELGTIELPGDRVKVVQFVPGLNGGVATSSLHGAGGGGEDPLKCDTVWVGSEAQQRVLVYSASDPERGVEVGRSCRLPASIASVAHHCDAVWVGLTSGQLAVFRRDLCSLRWELGAVQLMQLGSEPVSCLFPMAAAGLYAACGKRVWVVDAYAGEQVVR